MQDNLLGIYESMKKGGNDLDDKDPTPLINGGATKESGYNKSLNDTYNDMCSDEDEEDMEDDDCECEDGDDCEKCSPEEDEEVIVKESKKISKPTLNTNMAKKSAFDKLYESVINENFGEEENSDLDALGLGDATPDSDLENDFGGEEEGEDSVTFTLDRMTAQSLVDVLQGVLGGDEEMGDEEGDLDFGDDEMEGDYDDDDEEDEEMDEEDGDEMEYEEDEERADTENLGDKGSKLKSKSSAKVKGKLNKKGKSATAVKPTDKQGNDGDFGDAISGGKKPNMGEGGKAKVSNLTKGSDFFK